MNEVTAKYSVPMIVKMMELLEMLSGHHKGLTVQEIHQELKSPKTTVFRIATTLLDLGYLGKDVDTNRYFISKKLFKLGISALGETNIVEIALEPMTRLRDRVKESVMLGVLIDDKVVLLEQVIGAHSFTFILKGGTQVCLHASAPGKVLFAGQSKQKQEQLLKSIEFTRFNENTIVDIEDFKKELEITKKRGYGVDIEEEISGVYCIGSPIYNQFGDAVACVWISAPKGRLPLDEFDAVGSQIIECAREISKKLGCAKLITP